MTDAVPAAVLLATTVLPGRVDGDGVGSPLAEITVCAPVLVSMAITALSSGWPRRRFSLDSRTVLIARWLFD